MADEDSNQTGQGPRVKQEQKKSSPKPSSSDTRDSFWTNTKKKSKRHRHRVRAAVSNASKGGDGTSKKAAHNLMITCSKYIASPNVSFSLRVLVKKFTNI